MCQCGSRTLASTSKDRRKYGASQNRDRARAENHGPDRLSVGLLLRGHHVSIRRIGNGAPRIAYVGRLRELSVVSFQLSAKALGGWGLTTDN
jgi:hypothetical protein